jgi:uncharacterized membrane protein YdjX (TVP38/TMEM64 family)
MTVSAPSPVNTSNDSMSRPTLLSRLGPAGLLGLFWTAAPALAGIYLLVQLDPVSKWLRDHGAGGWLIYVVVFMVSAGFGLLPTYAQSILGGWVFGIGRGVPCALSGFVGGSLIGYGIARTVSRHRVEQVIEENPKARAIRDTLIGHGFLKTLGVVALLRLPPNSPFALTNLVMASTGVPLTPYILGTAIGMLPRTALAVAIGAIGAREAKDIQELATKEGMLIMIGGLVVMIVVLMILGAMANKALERVNAAAAAKQVKDATPR